MEVAQDPSIGLDGFGAQQHQEVVEGHRRQARDAGVRGARLIRAGEHVGRGDDAAVHQGGGCGLDGLGFGQATGQMLFVGQNLGGVARGQYP